MEVDEGKKRKRKPYGFGACGLPKKGHVCAVVGRKVAGGAQAQKLSRIRVELVETATRGKIKDEREAATVESTARAYSQPLQDDSYGVIPPPIKTEKEMERR
jgi:hypothetical protein